MISKISIFICFILLITCFTGCSTSNGNADNGIVNMEEDTEVASGDDILSQYKESMINLTDYFLDDNNMSEFVQNWCSTDENGNGYYYRNENFLYYYDIASKTVVPVCNRADCLHSDNNCNACLDRDGNDYYGYEAIYSDGYIYMVYVVASTGDVNLSRFNADGSGRDDDYMVMYKVAAESDGQIQISYPETCICNGYVYFIYDMEAVPKLRRIKLGGDEVEVIFETSGEGADIYRMRYSGDYLFFQSGNWTDEDNNDFNAGLFAYNTVSGELSLVKSSVRYTYTVYGTNLYYYCDEAIYRMSLIDGDGDVVVENISGNDTFHVVDDVIYVWHSDAETLVAYNMDGEKIASLPSAKEKIWMLLFGDTSNFIAYGDGTIVILNINDFLAGNGKWVRLN